MRREPRAERVVEHGAEARDAERDAEGEGELLGLEPLRDEGALRDGETLACLGSGPASGSGLGLRLGLGLGIGLGLDGEALAAEAEEGAPQQHAIEPAGAARVRARRRCINGALECAAGHRGEGRGAGGEEECRGRTCTLLRRWPARAG